MSDLLDNLNEVQKEAASYINGPLLILAGAGSGKTRVLTYKIAYLLEESICKPWEILAITFTNKAAKEMKERVEALVGANSKDIWLGTFHSICVRILKSKIDALGYTKDFNILDELDKAKVIKDVLKKLDISDKEYSVSFIASEISRAKNNMQSCDEYLKEHFGDLRYETIAKVFKEYQEQIKKNNSIDFDDILCLTVELFKSYPDVLLYYQNKFKHILVDEYQDTNHVQFLLISMLASLHGNICVVGDESQSIYAFRGADISNIIDFEKEYDNAKVIKLEQNYRSTKNILNVANAIINNNESKIEKKLWTENDEGEKIKYFTSKNEYDEVDYIVDKIDSMCRTKRYTYKDFVLLYRTNAQSRVIEDVFMRTSTPYKLIGGTKFYARKEIKDVIAYLKLVNNNKDNISLARIVNEPKRGIGETTLEKIAQEADKMNLSIFEYISNYENTKQYRCSSALNDFKLLIDDLCTLKEELKVSGLMKSIIELTGYEEELLREKTLENESRLENIYELIGVAKEFEEEEADNTLGAFLDSIALVADTDNIENGEEAVTLMTMHNAKGLEYPVVFILGMEEGLFPSRRSLDEDKKVEEERRLCYVAITRAKKEVFLTNAKQRTMYGATSYTIPSRFIDEIPKEYLDGSAINNIENNKRREEKYLDSEYAKIEKYISSTFLNDDYVTSSKSSYNKLGVDAKSFLNSLKNSKDTSFEKDESSNRLKVGDKVKHKKFGVGIVTNITEEENMIVAEISFESFGMKRLIVTNTTLEIIG